MYVWPDTPFGWLSVLNKQNFKWLKWFVIYLNKVKMAWASLNVKRQKVEGDYIAFWLVNDPLTFLIMGIGTGMVGGA